MQTIKMEHECRRIVENFDTRIKSGFSIDQYSNTFKKEREDILNQLQKDKGLLNKTNIKVTNIKKINLIIKNKNFAKKYGRVDNFKISLDYFILCTSASYLIIFDFELNLLGIINILLNDMKNDELNTENYIQSIDIYFNSLLVSTKNSIKFYDLRSLKLLTTIPNEAHNGSKKLKLLSDSLFLLADNTKLIKHKVSHHLFTYTYKTTQLISLNNDAIHDFEVLPLSSKKSKYEDLQLIACITNKFLLVIGLNPLITYIKLKIPKNFSKHNDAETNRCIWFPECKDEEKIIHHNPRLLYSSDNTLFLIEINNDIQIVNDTRRKLILDGNIKSIQWLNSNLIIVIVEIVSDEENQFSKIYLVSPDELEVLNSSEFINFHNDPQVFKNHIFLINSSNFFSVAKLTSFSNFIIQFPNNLLKLYTALNLFISNDSYYLQFNRAEIQERLTDLILIKPDNNYTKFADTEYNPYLMLCFEAVAKLKKADLFSKFIVNYPSNDFLEFFKIMKQYIRIGEINQLPADVLQQFIISNKNDIMLEYYLCLLDIKELDLDLILKFRHLKSLKAYIYGKLFCDYVTCFVEFIEDMKTELYSDADSLYKPQQNDKFNKNIIYKYLTYVLTSRQYPLEDTLNDDTYLIKRTLYNIIFSGSLLELPAGSTSYLFVSENPIIDEPSFPYISLLLKYDCQQCLKMLNEVFEDDFFNQEDNFDSENEITKQYIIEILINIYKNDAMSIFDSDSVRFKQDEVYQNRHLNKLLNNVYLSIFILRNYPKYYQVIKINDNLIFNLIENFYNLKLLKPILQTEKDFCVLQDDVELSLMSLIEIYNLHNFEFYYYFEQNEFFRVLFQLYKVDKNVIDLLRLWLNHDLKNYSNIQILNLCWRLIIRDTNITDFLTLIRNNFVEIITDKHKNVDDFEEVILCLQKIDPSLTENIFNLEDESNKLIKYKYIKQVIDLQATYNNTDIHIDISDDLKKPNKIYNNILSLNEDNMLQFIELMCQFEIQSCLKYVQVLALSSYSSSFVDKLVLMLRKYNSFDCLVYIYQKMGNDVESLNEIIKFLQYIFINMEDLLQLENRTWKYFNIAIKNCLNIEKVNKYPQDQPNKVSDSYLKLFSSLNNLIKLLKLKSFQPEKIIILKRFITETFTCMDDKNMKNIVNEYFMNGKISINSSIDQINEIFENLQHQNLKLHIILKLYNNEVVSKNMESLSEENLKGYCLNLNKCAFCDKVIYGKFLRANKYLQFWEFRELYELHGSRVTEEQSLEQFSDLKLVIFKCGHGYHLKCLSNLGEKEDNLKCIICKTSWDSK